MNRKQREGICIYGRLWLLDSDAITIDDHSFFRSKKNTDEHTPCAGTIINHLLGRKIILVAVLVSTDDVFCPPGYYCPSTIKKLS
jgi:hypothetical protein